MPTLTRTHLYTLAAVGLLCLTLGLWLVVEKIRGEPVKPVEVVGASHPPVPKLDVVRLEVGSGGVDTDLGHWLPQEDSVRERVIGR